MATIDQQFVEYIVKTLVNNPEKVAVERQIDEKGVLLSLSVDPEDVGRVIGKRGVTAQAIRVLLRALGTKQDARYNLKIVNTDEDGSVGSSNKSTGDAAGGTPMETPADMGETAAAGPVDDAIDTNDDVEDDTSSELAEKTRAELADLDDLDI